jgi:hypothetical protein
LCNSNKTKDLNTSHTYGYYLIRQKLKGGLKKMAILGFKTKKGKAAERTAMIEADEKKIDQMQAVYGQELESALTGATRKNTLFNTFRDGTVSTTSEPLEVKHIVNNGGSYSVFVQAGYTCPIWQIDVNMRENRVHTFYGAYGPDNNYALSDFDIVKNDLARHVEKVRHFG